MEHARRAVVGVLIFATLSVPLFLSNKNFLNVEEVVEEVSRIARQDCMNIWSYKMQALSMRRAEQESLVAEDEKDEDAPFKLFKLFENEYSCELVSRLGRRHGPGGSYICGMPLIAERRHCNVYSISQDGEMGFERDLTSLGGCNVHSMTPSGADMMTLSAKQLLVSRKTDYVGVGNSVEIHGGFEAALKQLRDHGKRLDVVRVNCPSCSIKFYKPIFDAVASGKVAIGQLIINIGSEDTKLQKLIYERKNALGLMVYHKQVHGDRAEISLIQEGEAKAFYRELSCSNSSPRLGNHVF